MGVSIINKLGNGLLIAIGSTRKMLVTHAAVNPFFIFRSSFGFNTTVLFPVGGSGAGNIIGKGSSTDGWSIRRDHAFERLILRLNNTDILISSIGSVPNNRVCNITGNFDYSGNIASIIINNTKWQVSNSILPNINTGELTFGSQGVGIGTALQGYIYNSLITKRIITDAEALDLYLTDGAKHSIKVSDTLLRYELEEKEGNTVYDSINGLNAELQNINTALSSSNQRVNEFQQPITA